jgi:hypothetical protein
LATPTETVKTATIWFYIIKCWELAMQKIKIIEHNIIIYKNASRNITKYILKTLTLILTTTILSLFSINCQGNISDKSNTPNDLLKYSIIKEDIYEIPLKTQVTLNVLISDKEIDKQKIKDLLNHLYKKTSTRTGFKHHKHPTNIYIYAFTSKDKANSGMGQWVGMISKSGFDASPTIDISERQLESLKDVAEDRWGLPFNRRQEIWGKMVLSEDKAQKEADKKYPLDQANITEDNMRKNVELRDELEIKYKTEIASEYGVDIAIIDSVTIEGLMNGWAFPK